MPQPVENENYIPQPVVQNSIAEFSHKEDPVAWQPEDDNPEENIGEEVDYDLEEEIPPNAGSAN